MSLTGRMTTSRVQSKLIAGRDDAGPANSSPAVVDVLVELGQLAGRAEPPDHAHHGVHRRAVGLRRRPPMLLDEAAVEGLPPHLGVLVVADPLAQRGEPG